MLKDYDDLMREVIPYVPGCPDSAAINAIRNAAIELLTRSHVFQVLSEEDQLSKGDDAYELDTPEQSEVAMLMEVWIDGQPIWPCPPDLMYQLNAGAPWPTAQGRPTSWIDQKGTVRFVPVPDANYKIVTRAAFRPTLDSTGIEDSIYRDYWGAIRAGALARLQEIPGQTWTDQKQAILNAAAFNRGLGNAKIDANRGRSRAELRIELPRFL